ncbi:General substrate transporter [Macrophomina phaseolina MS6]|uniref:General substrate transporter n=1 Tax=Macrophomina phaseolina (strain MS6) TaxID=1126212 RepID=K2S460_MACPH|nr:General substrate transporter [Macrophomina phaseolina MS6]
MAIWIVGQLIATFSSGHLGALYTARFISGLGIGPLTVTGPMSIVEVAPHEIRGLLATWFSVVMLLSLTVSCFVVYASFLHIAPSTLQYQVVWFVPCIIIAVIIAASFFVMYESPRWLMLRGREEEALQTLVALRGLPAHHPRVASEIADIRAQIESEHARYGGAADSGMKAVLRETFLVRANLRRVQQSCLCYILAQLSGANSVTSYLVPILTMIGQGGSTDRSMFLTGMYSMAKFFYTLIASFFFVDALGRRKSLFVGIVVQMVSDIYIGAFLKHKQAGAVAPGSSEGAIAAIYIHGFGYAVGKCGSDKRSRDEMRKADSIPLQASSSSPTSSAPSSGPTTSARSAAPSRRPSTGSSTSASTRARRRCSPACTTGAPSSSSPAGASSRSSTSSSPCRRRLG